MNPIIKLIKSVILLVFPLLLFTFFMGCDKIEEKGQYVIKIPIQKKLGEIRASSIKMSSPLPMNTTGKIYLYKDYLFINEPNKGIHIYDNANPSSPKALGFIPIVGNFDLGVQNDLLYADNIVDLITIDISNISKPVLIDRQKDVFAVKYIMNGVESSTIRDENLVTVDYRDSLVSFQDDRVYKPGKEGELIYDNGGGDYNSSNGGNNNVVGQAGSMARFAITSNHLYAIFQDKVKNFDLKNPKKPNQINAVSLGFGIETLFPYKKNLFVGANNGMHIMDISNPIRPVHLSSFNHAFACDPVVVNDNYAFVTLRSGNACGGNSNLLEVVDIKDPKFPVLKESYVMKNPHGLALTGEHLYVCEGTFGMKSFKVSDVSQIDKNLLENLEDLKSFDVIAGPKSLIVFGPESICQFDYSNKAKLKKLSCISILKK